MPTVRSAVIALIVANVIWGAAPPLFKWSLQDVGLFTLAFLRFGGAALIFFPLTWGRFKIAKRDILKLLLVGLFGIFVNITFFFYGLEYAPSINASIIGSAGPIFIVLASLLFVRVKPKGRVVIGSFIGLLGVLVLLIVPLLTTQSNFSSLGNLYFLIALSGAVIQVFLSRQLMQKYLALTITFWSFLIGAASFLPFFVLEVANHGFLPNLTVQGMTGIVFGIYLSSALAYYLYFYALKYLQAAEVSIFVYIDPVVTILVAIPLLGEIPDLTFLAGAFLVFGGIFVSEGRLHWHPLHRLR